MLPDAYLKQVTDRMASSLAEAPRETLLLVRQLAAIGKGEVAPRAIELDATPSRIGMWDRVEEGGVVSYRRPAEDEQTDWNYSWRRWADVESIPPKGEARRIVYLGESAARGFGLDPSYRPALVLEQLLRAQGGGAVEVIDLAATNASDAELAALLRQVGALKPDALVIYAGNNWVVYTALEEVANRQVAAAAVRSEGFGAVKTLLNGPLAPPLSSLDVLRHVVATTGVPAVVLLPEYNLVDWLDPPTEVAPWLPDDGNRSWWERHAAAVAGLLAKDFAAAAKAAREMVALDGGTSPIGYQLLAHASHGLGDAQAEREALEGARDASLWDANDQLTPRCLASNARKIAAVAGDGITVVSMPELFAGYGKSLPDRRLFLDYCHLSAEGIRVAMAAVARSLLGDGRATLEGLLAAAEPPAPIIEAAGHLMIAAYSARLCMNEEIVAHHLARVVEVGGEDGRRLAADYLEVQGRRVAPYLAARAPSFVDAKDRRITRLLNKQFMSFNLGRYLDDAMLDKLAELLAEHGIDRRAWLRETREAEWSSPAGEVVDLLAPEWRGGWGDPSWPSAQRAWYRAYTPRSTFRFVLDRPANATLSMTLRAPRHFRPAGKVVVAVGDQRLGELALKETWSSVSLEVPQGATRKGVNHVVVQWSAGSWDGAGALRACADALEDGHPFEARPSFGDLRALELTRLER